MADSPHPHYDCVQNSLEVGLSGLECFALHAVLLWPFAARAFARLRSYLRPLLYFLDVVQDEVVTAARQGGRHLGQDGDLQAAVG